MDGQEEHNGGGSCSGSSQKVTLERALPSKGKGGEDMKSFLASLDKADVSPGAL